MVSCHLSGRLPGHLTGFLTAGLPPRLSTSTRCPRCAVTSGTSLHRGQTPGWETPPVHLLHVSCLPSGAPPPGHPAGTRRMTLQPSPRPCQGVCPSSQAQRVPCATSGLSRSDLGAHTARSCLHTEGSCPSQPPLPGLSPTSSGQQHRKAQGRGQTTPPGVFTQVPLEQLLNNVLPNFKLTFTLLNPNLKGYKF